MTLKSKQEQLQLFVNLTEDDKAELNTLASKILTLAETGEISGVFLGDLDKAILELMILRNKKAQVYLNLIKQGYTDPI